MQPELLITVLILYFIGWSIAAYIGYRIGQKNNYPSQRKEPLTLDDIDLLYQQATRKEQDKQMQTMGQPQAANPNAEKLSKKDDIINHEGIGIVYRPTEEEINKMNEPESERQAKEAIAETIRNTPAPEI